MRALRSQGIHVEVPVKKNDMSLPILLRVAMVLGAVFGTLGTAIGVLGLFRLALGDASFRVDDTVLSRAEVVAIAGPFLILYISACLTAGAASWAIWTRRARSRALLVALLAEFVLGDAAMLVVARRTFGVGMSEVLLSASVFTVLVALALWYLFRKASVVEYYSTL